MKLAKAQKEQGDFEPLPEKRAGSTATNSVPVQQTTSAIEEAIRQEVQPAEERKVEPEEEKVREQASVGGKDEEVKDSNNTGIPAEITTIL